MLDLRSNPPIFIGVSAAAPDVLTAAAVVTGPLLEPLDSVCSWDDFRASRRFLTGKHMLD